jgi:hypothetical protein
MRQRGRFALRIGVTIAAQFIATAVAAADLFAIGQGNTLHRLAAQPLWSQPLGPVHPLAADAHLRELIVAEDGTAYTLDMRGNRLLTIRLQDRAVVSSVHLDQLLLDGAGGFDIDPDGTLWGIFPDLQLRTVNPLNGQTVQVARISGATSISSIAFADDGTLYAVGGTVGPMARQLFTISTDTGAARLIAELPLPELHALTWAPDGFLYAAGPRDGVSSLFRIDPRTGHVANLGSTSIVALSALGALRPEMPLEVPPEQP